MERFHWLKVLQGTTDANKEPLFFKSDVFFNSVVKVNQTI